MSDEHSDRACQRCGYVQHAPTCPTQRGKGLLFWLDDHAWFLEAYCANGAIALESGPIPHNADRATIEASVMVVRPGADVERKLLPRGEFVPVPEDASECYARMEYEMVQP